MTKRDDRVFARRTHLTLAAVVAALLMADDSPVHAQTGMGCPEEFCAPDAGSTGPSRGAAPREMGGGEGDPFAGVRLDRPRAGPGIEILHALAKCVEEQDLPCVDRMLHGGELTLRLARRSLEDGSISVERPGLIDHYRRLAAAGGQERFRHLLMGSFNDCQVALLAAARGRCDDIGWVEPPPSPLQGADPAYTELLGGLWRDVGRGLRERRARRLVCGVMRMGERLVAEEVVAVLAGRQDGSLALIDLHCSSIEKYLVDRVDRAVLEAGRPPWPPPDPESAGALIALVEALDCMSSGGGRCMTVRAPLPGILVRDLNRRLAAETEAGRQQLLDGFRNMAIQPQARAGRLLRLAPMQCLKLGRLPDPKLCTASEHRPWTPDFRAPEDVSESHASQVRALSALLWGASMELDPRTSRVTCPLEIRLPGGEDHVSVDVVWARDQSGASVLLDLDCQI